MGPCASVAHRGRGKQAPRTAPLKLRVPMGTVVKRKRGGALVGELIRPGDTLLVARGGRGGLGLSRPAPRPKPAGGGRRRFLDGDVSPLSVLALPRRAL